MKIKLLLFLSALFSFFMAAPSYAQVPESKIFAADNLMGTVSSYSYDGRVYLNASQAARALGGKMDFLPASGRLVLTAKGLKIFFSSGKNSASINGSRIELSEPLIIRAGVPFISAESVAAPEAADAYGSRITVNAAASGGGAATAAAAAGNEEKPAAPAGSEAAGNAVEAVPAPAAPSAAGNSAAARITAVRAADHDGKTRLVFQLDAPRNWTEQGNGRILNIGIPWAVPYIDNAVQLKGLLINSVKISSDSYGTNARIELAEEAKDVSIFALPEPDRIVIDVFDKPQSGKPDMDLQNKKEQVPVQEIQTAAKIVPLPSILEEKLDDPDSISEEVFSKAVPAEDIEEDISSYPELKPLPEGEKTDLLSPGAEKQSDSSSVSASAEEKKKTSAGNVKALKTKSSKGRTSKKVSSHKNAAINEAAMSASVMAGLKASGLDYASAKNAESAKKKKAIPSSSVSRAVKQGRTENASAVLKEGKRILVLDASHGGRDNGSQRKFGLYEKQYSLLLAREIKELFEGNEVFQVLLTRNSDEFMPVKERSRISNENKADLFVSVHGNSSKSASSNGFEVYSLSDIMSDSSAAETAERENSSTGLESESERPFAAELAKNGGSRFQEESRRLASMIASELARGTSLKNNGVKQGNLILLRLTEAPSVFVFAGYMTNTADKKIMDDKHSRKRIARSVYNGIMSYAEMKGWTKK